MAQFKNPIIPGFYPDPSIIRRPEGYYLVCSSFEFYPGVPLFFSRDLVNWEQVGNVLDRPSQLPLQHAGTSGGIFAPTLRYHEGRYYMVTTNVSDGGNFYVYSDDIRSGKWSEPIYIDHRGIDPSFFFDEDGRVYYAGTHSDADGRPCIGQFEIDLETGEKRSETRVLWYGTGGKCPEAPHMYKRGDYYYLMLAEGGTEYGHMVTIARSRSVWGPFESCPHNPILSHRDINPRHSELQGVGHADMVEREDGSWAIVFHGIRPSQFMLHHLGRETCVAELTWDEEGWPVVNGGKPIEGLTTLPVEGYADDARVPQTIDEPYRADFARQALDASWNYLRNPQEAHYRLDPSRARLQLTAGEGRLDEIGSPTFVGRRQSHFDVDVEVLLELDASEADSDAGLTVFHTNQHHYDLVVRRQGGRRVALLRRRVVDMYLESEPVELPDSAPLRLRIEASRLGYDFFAGAADGALQKIGSGSTQLLSTECMVCTFTGCYIGLFVEGGAGERASFGDFSYVPRLD